MCRSKLFKSFPYFLFIVLMGMTSSVFSQKQLHKTHIVEIKKMKFVPEELIINPGDSVVWINKDFLPHDVTEFENKAWSSSSMPPGKSWGTIITRSSAYYCSLHIVMKGKLIVK